MAHNYNETVGIRLSREPEFELGAVMVYPATRQVVRNDRSETLEPRIMQVLVAFAQSEGEILGHDDLIERCWEGRIVGENAIHRAVSKVRDLGLNFGGGSFAIETITKVGYRMSVRWGDAPGNPDVIKAGRPPVEAARSLSHSRRWVIGAGGAASVAAAGGLGYRFLRTDPMDARVAALVERSDQAIRNALPETDAQGVGFLEEAVKIQPGSAFAWGRLALARGIVAEHSDPADTAAMVAATQDAARRALALDKRAIDALAALALLPPYYGDWLAAEQRMDSVLALDPQNLAIRDVRCFMHVGVGRAREGSADRVLMAARDPLHAGYLYKLIYSYWILGDVGAADRAAERGRQLWPKHPGIWLAHLSVLAFTGRAARALAFVDDEAARPDLPPWFIDSLRINITALDTRRPADIAAAVTSALSTLKLGPSMAVSAVMYLNGLGEIDRAFDVASAYLLERGPLIASLRWRNGQVSINDQRHRKTNMLFIPSAAAMRADKRFIGLTEQIGLRSYWDRIGVQPDFLR